MPISDRENRIADMISAGSQGQYLVAHQPDCDIGELGFCSCTPEMHRVDWAKA